MTSTPTPLPPKDGIMKDDCDHKFGNMDDWPRKCWDCGKTEDVIQGEEAAKIFKTHAEKIALNKTLLDCPFCGNQAKLVPECLGHWEITCTNCACVSQSEDSKEKAITAWNTRSPTWMPIESAPKDGTIVILKAGDWYFEAYWDFIDSDTGPMWLAQNEGVHPPSWHDGACWSNNADEEQSELPTHWLPLPLPPKENSDE